MILFEECRVSPMLSSGQPMPPASRRLANFLCSLHMMKRAILLSGLAAVCAAGCAPRSGRELPPPSSAKSVSIFDYSRTLDRNRDGFVTNDEWVASGGSEGKIRPASRTADEEPKYIKARPHRPLTNLMVRVADIGGEEPMTPEEFRSPPGVRVASLEF